MGSTRYNGKFVSIRGLSFDDVIMVPARSDVAPDEADVRTRLCSTLDLNIPLMSAAMDKVTEAGMAIALARQGGIGVIHRNLSVEDQVAHVRRVKRAESTVIHEPVHLTTEHTLGDARSTISQSGISGMPVVDAEGVLCGIITRRDLRGVQDWNAPVASRMIGGGQLVRASANVSIEQAEDLMNHHRIEKLPLVDAEGKLCGLITMRDIESRRQFPSAIKDDQGRLLVAAAVGTGDAEKERVQELAGEGLDIFVIDTSHGHSKRVLDMLEYIKSFSPIPVVAGNITTREGARELIESGADALKVGIGAASICTTRIVTGGGMPQLTAIMEVGSVAKGFGVPVIADGGIRWSGDIVKALIAGADCVMIGSLFAGAEEAPGDRVILDGRVYKVYSGMGSEAALQKRGSLNRYGHSADAHKAVAEGVEGMVPYKGNVKDIVGDLIGGLRLGMGMAGVLTIRELQQDAKLIQVTHASLLESHPHDVVITREPANYSPQGLGMERFPHLTRSL